MAKFKANGVDDLIKKLNSLGRNADDVAKEAINAATPTLEHALKQSILEAANRIDAQGNPYSTGELAASIEATAAKTNAYGNFAAVRPTGVDRKGLRNGEKMAYLEYGTSKQEARPCIKKAINRSKKKCMDQMKGVIEKRVKL